MIIVLKPFEKFSKKMYDKNLMAFVKYSNKILKIFLKNYDYKALQFKWNKNKNSDYSS